MKRLIVLAMGIVYACLSFAQSEVDALRYSQSTFGGTARYNAMSGAFGALGADFSTLSSNPAGIAMYRKSEVSFTPSIFNQTTTSTYNNKSASDSKFNFNVGNAGIVGTFDLHPNEDQGGWISCSFGFGYNRMANFNNRISIEGPNTGGSSLVDIYLRNANGVAVGDLNQYGEGLAFNTYVIDSASGPNHSYFSVVPTNLIQRKTIETMGSMGETVLSFGGNYDNKLYLGATVGFQHISYTENSTYTETAAEPDTLNGFKSFSLSQQINTRGTGINIKLGMMYHITDWMRIGAAFHSPTAFTMHDDYVYTMNSSYTADSKYAPNDHTSTSPNGSFDYRLVTPPRAIGSLGFIIAKRGLIGIDYEFVDYTYARLSSSADVFFDANDQIRKKYTSTGNLRVGGEVRASEHFSLRGGFAMYGNPYKSGVNTDATRMSYSAGIGLREKNYFIDLAYVMTQYKEDYYLYDPTNIKLNAAHNNFSAYSIMATLGVKF
jgi:long-subunit fatty acid transport protein